MVLFASLLAPGLAVGLDPEGYGNPDFCWISIDDKLIWSFAGPIAIVILVTASPQLYRPQCANTSLKFVLSFFPVRLKKSHHDFALNWTKLYSFLFLFLTKQFFFFSVSKLHIEIEVVWVAPVYIVFLFVGFISPVMGDFTHTDFVSLVFNSSPAALYLKYKDLIILFFLLMCLYRWMEAFSWSSPRFHAVLLRRRPRSFPSCKYTSSCA